MLGLLLLLTIDAPTPAREPVLVTHDLATIAVEDARALPDGRHRFRVVRDSDTEEVNGRVSFDCEGPDDGHRSVTMREGHAGGMAAGLVEARVRVIRHGGWGPFAAFREVRLVDAVRVE